MRRRLAGWMVMLGFSVIVSIAAALDEQYSHRVSRCGRGCNEAWAALPLSTIVEFGVGSGLGVWLVMKAGTKLRLGARLAGAVRRVLPDRPAPSEA